VGVGAAVASDVHRAAGDQVSVVVRKGQGCHRLSPLREIGNVVLFGLDSFEIALRILQIKLT
jgi:hypothetical protein